jgi:hypothetical protein
MGLQPLREGANIGAIGPDEFQPRQGRRRRLDHLPGAKRAMHVGGMDMHQKDQA